MNIQLTSSEKCGLVFIVLIISFGVFLRFVRIKENDFLFYDEGMWLSYNRDFLRLVESNPPKNFIESQKIFSLLGQFSLATAKSFWAFLSMIRVFFVGESGYYFTRVVSAVFGTVTLILTFLLGSKIYHDKKIGLLAAGLLAILPSHVFYSRLALQESLSAFFFTAGLLLYVSSSKLSWRTFLSSACFVLVFLSSYRMIIIPVFIVVFEGLFALANSQKFNFRKYVWHTLTFLLLVFLIGSLYRGSNTQITFAWMFYQAHLAEGTVRIYNFLSFPYYMFRLESLLFGLCFFSQIYFLIRKEWLKCFLFIFILFEMLVFSLSEEKGARYLASSLPLLAISVSAALVFFYNYTKARWVQGIYIVFFVGMILFQGNISYSLSERLSDYRISMEDLKQKHANVKVLSTQNQIQQLYVQRNSDVLPPPTTEAEFLKAYLNGYRFLIIDPQAYISFTEDKKRFSVELRGYLNFIKENVDPYRRYQHISPQFLDRFVLEHNVDLKESIKFLSYKAGDLGVLYVYDIQKCLSAMKNDYEKVKGH